MVVICISIMVLGFFFALPCIIMAIEMIITRARIKRNGEELAPDFYKQFEPREEDCSLMIAGVIAAIAACIYLLLNIGR